MMRLTPGAVLLVLVAGCSCEPSKSCTSTSDCGAGFICSRNVCQVSSGSGGGGGGADAGAGGGGGGGASGGGGGMDAGSTVMLTRIEVSPQSSTLQSINGATPTQAFTVTAFFDDGSSSVVPDADFSVDQLAIGTVAPVGGPFTASGLVGGLVTVTASVSRGAQTQTAQATIQVQLEQTFAPPGAPGDLSTTTFGGTPMMDASRTAGVVYPLDGVVFPQNVAPPDVQWLNGAAGDWMRVRITKPDITLTSYTLEDGNHHLMLDPTAWRALAQTNPLATASLEVTRYDAANQQLIAGTPRSMRFASAALVGSVYYWDIVRGRIVRIDDGTTTRTEIMPSPPAGVDGATCVGCHVVSPSGRYMVGRLGGGDNIGAVFDLTTNLTATPAATVWPISNMAPETPRWWFASFNPTETRVAISRNESGTNDLAFMDPFTGAIIAPTNPLNVRVTHPAWSPDGTRIAYTVLSGPGDWGGNSTTGDIGLVPVTGDALGTPTILHQGASLSGDMPGGNADGYPTWTPDSRWLAFSHGGNNRSEGGTAALYFMKADGTEVRRLSRASGGMTTTDTFQPRFSPFKAGGYFWMSFLSTRDYGNAQVGTAGSNRQQIWVAALSENPSPSADPSEVGYWLPGQNTQSQNIAAYWAPRACRQAGSSCSVGSECCSGDCRMDMGSLRCSPPPPERCRRENETCGGTGDCCPGLGLVCSQNVCILDIQ